MKRNVAFMAVILLMWSVNPVFAGSYAEKFNDYSGRDPIQTTACWNPTEHCLKQSAVEAFQTLGNHKIVGDDQGNIYILVDRYNTENSSLYLSKFDAVGNPMWEELGVKVPESVYTGNCDLKMGRDGDLLIVWTVYTPEYSVMAMKYNSAGEAVWNEPVKVNEETTITWIKGCHIGILQNGEAFIFWCDNRTGTLKPYYQLIGDDGEITWGADEAIPGVTGMVLDMDVDSVGNGRCYCMWIELDTDTNLYWNWIDKDTGFGFATPQEARISNTNNPISPGIRQLDLQNVMIGWIEESGGESQVKLIRRDTSGATPWGSDKTVDSHPDSASNLTMAGLPGGDVLLSYVMGEGVESQAYVRKITADGSSLGTRYEVDTQDWRTQGGRVPLAAISNAVYAISIRLDRYSPFLSLFKLNQNGQPEWTSGVRLANLPGAPCRVEPSFIHNSGMNRGFSITYSDSRNRFQQPFARTFVDPENPYGANDVRLCPEYLSGGQSCGAMASDGRFAVAWVTAGERYPRIMGCWYDAEWNPLLSAPVELALDLEFVETPEIDMAIDSNNRAIVGWSAYTGANSGAYLQGFLTDGSLAFDSPVKVDTADSGTNHKEISLDVYADNAIGVAWRDDRFGDYMIFARRIDSTGTPVWLGDALVFNQSGYEAKDPEVVVKGEDLVVFLSAYKSGNSKVYMISYDATGSSGPLTVVSDTFDFVDQVQSTLFGSDIVIGFIAQNSSTGINVYAQRIAGTTSSWPVTRVNVMDFGNISGLDIAKTQENRISVVFSGVNLGGYSTFLQELSSSGTRSFNTGLPVRQPEPIFSDPCTAVSKKLNTDDFFYAVLSAQDNPSGGFLNYYLSNDGGLTWYPTKKDKVLVFPSPGSDLRWGVDIYGDGSYEVSPEITQVVTTWDEEPVAVDLLLNGNVFRSNDLFSLKMRLANSGPAISVEEYVILDVVSNYWFWPRWTDTVDNRTETLETGITEETLMEFTWPADTGFATGILFYAGLLAPGGSELLGPYDWVSFDFE